MQFFCSPRLCKSGKSCSNLPFSMRPVVHDLEVFWTGNRGFGLRTNSSIKAGDFVMQYVGEIITINESYRRTVEDYKGKSIFH
jgi:SET domain-containing protein